MIRACGEYCRCARQELSQPFRYNNVNGEWCINDDDDKQRDNLSGVKQTLQINIHNVKQYIYKEH